MFHECSILKTLIHRIIRKRNQIKHLSHPAPYPDTINLFNFAAVEVGGDMGNEFLGDEQIIVGEQDPGHDVAVVAIVFEGVFVAQVIETIGFGMVVMKRLPEIPGNDLVAVLDKFKMKYSGKISGNKKRISLSINKLIRLIVGVARLLISFVKLYVRTCDPPDSQVGMR